MGFNSYCDEAKGNGCMNEWPYLEQDLFWCSLECRRRMLLCGTLDPLDPLNLSTPVRTKLPVHTTPMLLLLQLRIFAMEGICVQRYVHAAYGASCDQR